MNRIAIHLTGIWLLLAGWWLTTTSGVTRGAEASLREQAAESSHEVLRDAVARSLPLLEAGARGSLEQRARCFTCHNQGLPIFALTLARTRGFDVDAEHLDRHFQHISGFLGRNAENFREGRGTGGQADTAGYALWTLDSGSWPADDVTAAVAEYLLRYQSDQDHWTPPSRRPPSEHSPFTTTYLALRGLQNFGTSEQQERIAARFAAAREWLIQATPQETEDLVFRLRGLHIVDAPETEQLRAAEALLAMQRDDGGWAQLPDLESDAYATGSALVALCETGRLAPQDERYRRGLRRLLEMQQEDGSWHVVSRSKPFQTYFESGYPHGTDQFISIAAAGWATQALLLALPERAAPESGAVSTNDAAAVEVDVCVYGATPGGILAAVAVQRAGRSVVIVEPGRWVGGMLGAGLKPLQDCPNFAATGGMTRSLLPTFGRDAPPLKPGDRSSLNPAAIRDDFQQLLDKHNVRVIHEHRVARCEKAGATITTAVFDLAPFDDLGCPVAEPSRRDGLRVSARVFIDASYEGDLLPRAGVSYRVGREAAAEFDEEHAGVQLPLELAPIDPFVTPGRPESGLLKWVEHDHGLPVGAADGYTQAYNYRYYTTADPEHRLPITPPEGYDPQDFELVGRYVAHLAETYDDAAKLRERLVGIFPGWLNSGEWNYQRSALFSMAPLGISQHYADGDAATQARVWKQHQDYLRGLHHFMSTDPRVPETYRREVAELGLDRRAHPDTSGWPHQLYIRVARRLYGRYTITAHDVYNRTTIDDPIGLAQYGIDTYPSRRIWEERDGRTWVGIEGKMFIGGNRGPTNVPYPIPYRAITPREEECTNLLVPVCFSATHLGYASARMEPVFMICGESAGLAACQAIATGSSVQQIDLAAFLASLEQAGQKLCWDPAVDRPSGAAAGSDGDLTFARLLRECDADGDGVVSDAEWNSGKPGWEWLFPFIDANRNGRIEESEYVTFQEYKARHPDWQKRIRGSTAGRD